MIRSSSLSSHGISTLRIEQDTDSSSIFESQKDLPSNFSSSRKDFVLKEQLCSNQETFPQKCDKFPLKLTCKQRGQSNSFSMTTLESCRSTTPVFKTTFQSNQPGPVIHATGQLQKLSTTAIERTFLHCWAQLAASNNFARAIMQKQLQQEMSSALFAAPIFGKYTNQWNPVINSLLAYKCSLFDNMHKNTPSKENQDVRKQFKDITNEQHSVESSLSLFTSPMPSPSPPPGDDVKLKLSPNVFSIKWKALNLQCSTSKKINDVNKVTGKENVMSHLFASPLGVQKKQQYRTRRFANTEIDAKDDLYQCSICSLRYPHKFELNRHIKVSHVRPHRCNHCGKGFGHKNYLKVHIETVHMGHKSHQCRLCGKYLSTGGNLNVHVRTIHLGEKKYICPVCKRSFGQQCNMKTHLKRHFTNSADEI